MRPAFALLAAFLLAGCFGRDAGPGGEGGAGAPAPWLFGDRWTYRLQLGCGEARDEWVVQGTTDLEGRTLVQVRSITTGCLEADEIGSFDARTLALRHVQTGDIRVTFDPAEVWLLPAQDRTYAVRKTVDAGEGTVEERATYTIDHIGPETIETDAGNFAAERFEVVRTVLLPGASRETRSTYWWSAVAMNVVRQDSSGETVRSLVEYRLADGSRTVPGAP